MSQSTAAVAAPAPESASDDGLNHQNVPSQLIPYKLFRRAPENVRRNKAPQSTVEQYAASMVAQGVLQNVLARPQGDDGLFELVAGETRLDAVALNIERGIFNEDYLIPAVVREWRSAREISLMENVLRRDMDDVDKLRAYVDLIEKDRMTAGEIASRFGLAEREVLRILKLGKLDDAVLDAYQQGRFEKSTLQAFTLSDDKARQLDVLKRLPAHSGSHARFVRTSLTDKSLSSLSRIGRFVGVSAYEGAGGAVTADMFAENGEVFFDDVPLVNDLADAKVQRRAKAIQKKWAWTKGSVERPFDLGSFDKLYPQPINVPDELTDELNKLEARRDELFDKDDDEFTEEDDAEFNRAGARIEEINREIDQYCDFSDEQRKRSGCIVTINTKGEYEYIEGLVRPEDSKSEASTSQVTPQTGSKKKLSPAEQLMYDAGISGAHKDDLTDDRTEVIQAHIANSYDVAFDLFLLSLTERIFSPTGGRNVPLDIQFTETSIGNRFGEPRDTKAAKKLSALEGKLDRSWLNLPATERFATLSALPRKAKQRLFSWCIARTLRPQLSLSVSAQSVQPAIEQAVERLDVRFEDFWRPGVEYFERIRKTPALQLGEDVLGASWAQSHRGDRKPALAKALERAFSGDKNRTATIDAEIRDAAAAWLPPGFAAATYKSEATDSNATEAQDGDTSPSSQNDGADTALPAFLEEETADGVVGVAAE